MHQIVTSLTDDSRGVIYDCQMFIEQATCPWISPYAKANKLSANFSSIIRLRWKGDPDMAFKTLDGNY